MAVLPLQSSYFTGGPHPHLHRSLSSISTKPKFAIISQDSSPSSQSSKPAVEEQPPAASKKSLSAGQGFGSGSNQLPKSNPSPKKQKGGRGERASVIRRTPLEKPAFLDDKGEEQAKEQSVNESAFLLAWLGLGGLILIEGIALASSGFLPEKWDKFFVKFLYPSFTPTVFVFVAGTVAYGVFKYLQNESLRNQK